MQELWHGYRCEKFTFEGRDAIVVFPKEGTANGRLALKTEYWDVYPTVELLLLERGFHLSFIKGRSRFAPKDDCDARAAFVKHLAQTYGLSEKCVPVGMSCGGAQAVRFAGFYPELISCMFIDAPVLNYCDFPGRVGDPVYEEVWDKEFLAVYPNAKRYRLFDFPDHPINMADKLVEHKIPIVMVYGLQDLTVLYEMNGWLLEEAYRGTDLLKVISVYNRGHHPHCKFHDNEEIVNFILEH